MKRFIFFALACSVSILAHPLFTCAQDSDAMVFPNYVVIGAFSKQQNAIHFTDEAKHNKYAARFEMNPNRNLYYVYVLTTDDREQARAEALRLRAETKYFDAWVYSGVFGNVDVTTLRVGEQQDFNPVTGQRLEDVGAAEQQRSTAQESTIPVAKTGQQTANTNRTGKSRPDQQADNVTTGRQISGQPGGGSTNNATTTGSQDSNLSADGAQKEQPARRDGAQQHVRTTPRAQPDQASLTSQQDQGSLTSRKSSADLNNPKNQRQAETSVKQEAGGSGQQSRVITNPQTDGQNTVTAQQQDLAGTKQNSEESAVSSHQATSDEITTTGKVNDPTQVTPSNTNQTSGITQNNAQASGESRQNRGTMQTNGGETTKAVLDIPPPVRQSTEPLSSEEVVGKNFYFHLYRADNQKTVPGDVDAIDFEKSRKMGTYPANESVKVTMAGGKMKHISFVCQVFGYRKQQQEFDPEEPSDLLYLDDKGNLVVPFELMRLQKGDIAIMYNVFFFKDAAVMRPESRYEVNNLLDLLVENPSYNIVIHGHTNGNASGKIIRMDKPGNFYSLSGTKQGFGSAKQLSEERAIVIREFLISSGISADRMQVKAWGGKKPIHDKHSVRAQENVRVEIEILSQ